jgi:hypothetical protein
LIAETAGQSGIDYAQDLGGDFACDDLIGHCNLLYCRDNKTVTRMAQQLFLWNIPINQLPLSPSTNTGKTLFRGFLVRRRVVVLIHDRRSECAWDIKHPEPRQSTYREKMLDVIDLLLAGV